MNLKTQRNILAVAVLLLLVALGVLMGTGSLTGAAGSGRGIKFDQETGQWIVTSDTELRVNPSMPGVSVVGQDAIFPDLFIHDSAGNDVVYITELAEPIAYGANKDEVLNAGNACSIPGGGMADVGSGDYSPPTKKHEYSFTFTEGLTVNSFKIGVLDWGDYLPFGACPDNYCAMVMTAYNANSEVVATSEMGFHTTSASAAKVKRTSDEYGNLQVTGDACTAEVGQPGRFTLSVTGDGITRVDVKFKDLTSMDPHTALWLGALEFEYECGTECDPTEEPTPTDEPTLTPTPTETPTATPTSTPTETPVVICTKPLDVMYVLDLSGSMSGSYTGSGSKLAAAKQAIISTNEILKGFNNGTKAALITFNGSGSPVASNPDRYSVSTVLQQGLTTDFTALNNKVNSLSSNGSTPIAHAMRFAKPYFTGLTDGTRIPVMIFLGDGVPTVSYESSLGATRGYGFQDAHVQEATMFASDGTTWLTISQVRTKGRRYSSYNMYSGEPLADAMVETDALMAAAPRTTIHAIAIQASSGGIFKEDMLKYLAYKGNGIFASANSLTALQNSLTAAIQTSCQ
jgi:hypothetical protein